MTVTMEIPSPFLLQEKEHFIQKEKEKEKEEKLLPMWTTLV